MNYCLQFGDNGCVCPSISECPPRVRNNYRRADLLINRFLAPWPKEPGEPGCLVVMIYAHSGFSLLSSQPGDPFRVRVGLCVLGLVRITRRKQVQMYNASSALTIPTLKLGTSVSPSGMSPLQLRSVSREAACDQLTPSDHVTGSIGRIAPRRPTRGQR